MGMKKGADEKRGQEPFFHSEQMFASHVKVIVAWLLKVVISSETPNRRRQIWLPPNERESNLLSYS